MDPAIILNPYILEEILKHVSKKDLNNFVTVSKAWYSAITSSSVLMKRFFLSVRGDWMNKEEFEDVVSCSKNRKFQNIIFSDGDEFFHDVYERILFQSENNWQKVEIYGLTLQTSDEFIKLIKTFESNVKTLVLSNIKITQPAEETLVFDFKNLKDLKLSFCSIEVTRGILKSTHSAKKLISLELEHAPEYCDNVIDYLKNMPSLKKLQMRGEWFTKFLRNCQSNEMPFQLEEFTIACIDYAMPKEVIDNFLKFLENQHRLKKINLSEWFGVQVLFCLYKMPTLRHLSIFISPFFRWNIEHLNKKNEIETLDVRTLDVTDELFNLLMLLSSAPNLKTLRIRSINEPLAYFIKQCLTKLESISLVHTEVKQTVKEILPHIEFN